MDIIDRLHGSTLTSKLIDDAIDEIERMRLIVAALEAERVQLRAELAECRRDAERYRWLLNAPFSAVSGLFIKPRSVWNSAIDAQDAALAAKE